MVPTCLRRRSSRNSSSSGRGRERSTANETSSRGDGPTRGPWPESSFRVSVAATSSSPAPADARWHSVRVTWTAQHHRSRSATVSSPRIAIRNSQCCARWKSAIQLFCRLATAARSVIASSSIASSTSTTPHLSSHHVDGSSRSSRVFRSTRFVRVDLCVTSLSPGRCEVGHENNLWLYLHRRHEDLVLDLLVGRRSIRPLAGGLNLALPADRGGSICEQHPRSLLS